MNFKHHTQSAVYSCYKNIRIFFVVVVAVVEYFGVIMMVRAFDYNQNNNGCL